MRLLSWNIQYGFGRDGEAATTRADRVLPVSRPTDRVRSATIDTTTKGSDHHPVVVELEV